MREELYHPLLAHFPLVLLGLTPLFLLVRIFLNNKLTAENKYTLDMALRFCHWGGLLFFLIVMFLGDMALDAVKETACSITNIYRHEDQAYYAFYFFGLALTDELLRYKWGEKLRFITAIFLISGVYFLIQTGHNGAKLVYDQGTGVQNYQCK